MYKKRLDFGKYQNIPVQIVPIEYLKPLYHHNQRFKQKEYDKIRECIEETYPHSLYR